MSGGGSGGGAAPQDNSLALEQMREAAADRAQQAADAKLAQQKLDFQNALSTAVGGARSTGNKALVDRGLDPSRYGNIIDQVLSDTQAKVPQLDPNPNQYFTSDVFDAGINNYQNLQRTQAGTKVQQAFAPGFENNYIPDNSYSSTIDDILNEQFNNAQKQVDYNRQRGTINDQGYAAAEGKLNAARSAGQGQLTDIGDAILGKGRTQLDQDRSDAGNAASTYALGSPDFSVDPFVTKARADADKFNAGIGGAVRNAVGNTNFFDIPTILTQAGIAQGPQNLTTNQPEVNGPLQVKKNRTDRGLGSTGTF